MGERLVRLPILNRNVCRALALVVALALLSATTAYLSHFHDSARSTQSPHAECELCLGLGGGVAGSLAAPTLISKAELVAWVLLPTEDSTFHPRPTPRSQRSRAPPPL
jgi:hypothetical protein